MGCHCNGHCTLRLLENEHQGPADMGIARVYRDTQPQQSAHLRISWLFSFSFITFSLCKQSMVNTHKAARQRQNKQVNYTQVQLKAKGIASLGGIRTHVTLQSRRALYQLGYQGNSACRGLKSTQGKGKPQPAVLWHSKPSHTVTTNKVWLQLLLYGNLPRTCQSDARGSTPVDRSSPLLHTHPTS